MIVDTHVHVVSDDTVKYPRPGKGPVEQPQWPDFTGEMLVKAMDECGIDRALTVQAYHTYHFDNSYAIDVALKYPKRFWSTAVEHFGANRLMWGSNYPAHWHLYGKLRERLAIMRKDLDFLSIEDQRWIFGESALRVWPTLR